MSNFKVGDWVKVLDKGQSFYGYTNFFFENNLNEFASKYARKSTVNGEHYQIVGIGKHSDQHDYYGPLYVLQAQDGEIYLMHNGCPHDPSKGFELTGPPIATPKFQIGDKVVPVSKSIGVERDPNKEQNWIDSKERGYFYMMGYRNKNGEVYCLCSSQNKHKRGNHYLESDLRPYAEPTPKPKFKPGDRIRIKPMSEIKMIVDAGPVFAGWSLGMTEYTEKVYTVAHLMGEINGVFGYHLREILYSWDERFLDLVVDEPEVKKEYPKEIDGEWVGDKSVFKVGDRVRVKETDIEELKGKAGIVKGIMMDGVSYGVEFDESFPRGHGMFGFALMCGEKGRDRHCRWFNASKLELLPPINHCPQNKTISRIYTTVPDFHLIEGQTIFNGPATVCVLEYDGEQFKGVAKCNPADQWNETTGQIIAIERAAIKLSEYRIAQAIK